MADSATRKATTKATGKATDGGRPRGVPGQQGMGFGAV